MGFFSKLFGKKSETNSNHFDTRNSIADGMKKMHDERIRATAQKGILYSHFVLAANRGKANTQFTLGMMFYGGEEIEGFKFKQSYKRAFWWISKAAQNGDKLANEIISIIDNDLVKIEEEAYLKICIQSLIDGANKGNSEFKYYLGKRYLTGSGIEKNLDKAVKLIHEAAKQGHDEAQYDLATMYFEGNSVEKNVSKAFGWYNKAAEQGYPNALEMLNKAMMVERINFEEADNI